LNVKLTKEELIDLYVPQSDEQGGRSGCATAEELVLAFTEEMSQPERERVTAHLTVCRDCAEEYRLIRPLRQYAEQSAAALGNPVAEVTLAKPRRQEVLDRPAWWQQIGLVFSPVRVSYAAAASLLIVSLALGAWILSLRAENQRIAARLSEEVIEQDQTTQSLEEARHQLEEAKYRLEQKGDSSSGSEQIAELRRSLEELSRPHINVPIVELEPQGSRRGEPSATVTIAVPSGATLFTLVLNVAGEQSYPGYALEIADRGGRLVWSGRGLQKSPQNTFTVALPRRLFPAGQYRIKLYGFNSNRRELIEDYPVRIEYK
jgi:hypothetical protein